MGGCGSGRRSGRLTVEGRASLVLDVKRVMRPVLAAHRERGFRPGETMTAGPIRFAFRREGCVEPWAAVAVSLELGPDRGHARIALERMEGRRGTGPHGQRVALEATPCRFGGVRWWWVCPATGRRAVRLHLPARSGHFLSRQAHGLVYASQNEDWIDRAHRRAARVHKRLGSPRRSAFGATPPKPKWMRWTTYERLAAELQGIDAALEEATERMAARLLARPAGSPMEVRRVTALIRRAPGFRQPGFTGRTGLRGNPPRC